MSRENPNRLISSRINGDKPFVDGLISGRELEELTEGVLYADKLADETATIVEETVKVVDEFRAVAEQTIEVTEHFQATADQIKIDSDAALLKSAQALTQSGEAKVESGQAKTLSTEAKSIAQGIDGKATQALENSIDAKSIAQNALDKVEEFGEDVGTVVKVATIRQSEINFDSDPQTQITSLQSEATSKWVLLNNVDTRSANILNNTTKIANAGRGFAGGQAADAASGGAVGHGAIATTGFAGGYNALAYGDGSVQLSEGTNRTNNTLQFRNYPLLDASGKIPNERLGIDYIIDSGETTISSISGAFPSSAFTGKKYYNKWESGKIEQWGTVTYSSNTRDTSGILITFQTPFTSGYSISGSAYRIDGSATNRSAVFTPYNKTLTSIALGWYGIGTSDVARELSWYCIGK